MRLQKKEKSSTKRRVLAGAKTLTVESKAQLQRDGAVLEGYRVRFNPVLKVQVFAVLVLFAYVLFCRAYRPEAFEKMQECYLTLFESDDYAPSLVRFTQQAVEVFSVQAEATSAPDGYSLIVYQTEERTVLPVPAQSYYISSDYGWRDDPLEGDWSFHGGVDFAAAEGTEVYAVMDGVVVCNYLSMSYGNCIMIRHADGSVSLYAHLQYAFAREGEVVQAGAQIGTVGQTGYTTGAHLHFEIIVNTERQDPSGLFS